MDDQINKFIKSLYYKFLANLLKVYINYVKQSRIGLAIFSTYQVPGPGSDKAVMFV